MGLLYTIIVFILFLGPLVFFHELGHFLFARLFGVRVETFSIGFGKKLFTFKRGDTTYAVSLIPLGGYVKMYGDNPFTRDEVPEAERNQAYNHKPVWQRFWIVFGGPLANFIMAFVIYWGLLQTGEKVPEVRFANYSSESYLSQAGIRPGDRLMAVNNIAISSIEDLILVKDQIETIKVSRREEIHTIELNLAVEEFIKKLSQDVVALSKPFLIKGDQKLLISENSNLEMRQNLPLESLILPGAFIHLFDADEKLIETIELTDEPYQQIDQMGYHLPEMVVDNIMMNSAAAQSKLQKGDVLTAINGQPMQRFAQLRDYVQQNKDQPMILSYRRGAEEFQTELTPKLISAGEDSYYAIGVQSSFEFYQPNIVDTVALGFMQSLPFAYHKTIDAMMATLVGFKKLFTAQIPIDSIGGPVAIAKVASDSLSISASYFFKIMALMSINLGLINLFPIPILDGGHIVFLAMEAIKRRPLNRRSLEFAQRVGFSLLLALISLALFNDIKRFF